MEKSKLIFRTCYLIKFGEHSALMNKWIETEVHGKKKKRTRKEMIQQVEMIDRADRAKTLQDEGKDTGNGSGSGDNTTRHAASSTGEHDTLGRRSMGRAGGESTLLRGNTGGHVQTVARSRGNHRHHGGRRRGGGHGDMDRDLRVLSSGGTHGALGSRVRVARVGNVGRRAGRGGK
jgi:hypothetical protein